LDIQIEDNVRVTSTKEIEEVKKEEEPGDKELKEYLDDRKAESEEIDKIEDMAIEKWQKGSEISKAVLSASEESSSSE